MYDTNSSGGLSGFEFRRALSSAGYHLNNHILNSLMHRYGNKKGEIVFDDFIMCAVKIKTMMRNYILKCFLCFFLIFVVLGIFKEKDTDNSNTAEFSLEEWMENTLYA